MNDKSAYRAKMEARLDQWRAEISELQAKAAEASADARIEYEKQIEQLKDMQEEARRKLAKIDEAGSGAWEDMKAGLEAAWDDLGRAVDSAMQRFR